MLGSTSAFLHSTSSRWFACAQYLSFCKCGLQLVALRNGSCEREATEHPRRSEGDGWGHCWGKVWRPVAEDDTAHPKESCTLCSWARRPFRTTVVKSLLLNKWPDIFNLSQPSDLIKPFPRINRGLHFNTLILKHCSYSGNFVYRKNAVRRL